MLVAYRTVFAAPLNMIVPARQKKIKHFPIFPIISLQPKNSYNYGA